MGFLSGLLDAIPGVASLAGSIIGGNSQKSAAQTAADAQLNLQKQQLEQAQQQEANYRAQIQKMLPFLQGPSQAATALQGQHNYLAPGQNGAMFGGQQLGSNGSLAGTTSNSNYLAQAMPQGPSGVPAPPLQSGLAVSPGISGSAGQLTMLPAGQRQVQSTQKLPGIG